ncbi:thiamine biosynthetic bifunctional enzyme TH1, chloroplastic isoform X2 [Cryptomeria japonica]|nr:thiamine biosynthetic bifunctional enzyme TH1, chloroplastic isoform X2 [Cryptomeria japonica]
MKACGARGVYCSTVITAVTAQNTVGVQGVHPVPENFVFEQLKSVLSDMEVDVVKTGMLPSTGIIQALCRSLREYPVRALVVDPVMVATSGDVLASPVILSELRKEILPMSDIITPNLKEASALIGGEPLETIDDMRAAAKSIHQLGPRYVLVKGGHLRTVGDVVDILYDGETYHELRGPRIQTHNTHGTGCSLASCIAAELAKGSPMLPAVLAAKRFIEEALEHSTGFLIGNGPQGPFNHLFKLSYQKAIPMKSIFRPNDLLLYAVTDSGMNKKWGRSISEAVRAAIEGGATIVQLREKEAETKEIITAAEECLKVSRSYGVPLLINDRIDVALVCNADGVHLGQSDMPVKAARAVLGPNKIIGASCKTPEQAQKAWEEGADYIGSGGVYPTNTKKNNQTIGLNGLQRVCESSLLPVVAIGGINTENAHEVMEMDLPKLKGVAVVSCLFNKENISAETHKLRSALAKYAETEN